MESQASHQRVQLICRRDGLSTEGWAVRRDFASGERVARGLKIAAAFWAVGFLTVFIPVLHFVLPPGFLILGVIFGTAAWHDKAEILEGEFTCPSCKALNKLSKQSESFPQSPRCSSCHLTLELSKME